MKQLFLTAALLLASCATEQDTLTTAPQLFAQATDTSRAAVVPLPAGGRYKFKGPVSIILQAGTGNVAMPTVKGTDKTGQRAQAVSTGAGSPIQASEKKGGLPWWVFGLVAIAGAGVWEWLSHRGLLAWVPWRIKSN